MDEKVGIVRSQEFMATERVRARVRVKVRERVRVRVRARRWD